MPPSDPINPDSYGICLLSGEYDSVRVGTNPSALPSEQVDWSSSYGPRVSYYDGIADLSTQPGSLPYFVPLSSENGFPDLMLTPDNLSAERHMELREWLAASGRSLDSLQSQDVSTMIRDLQEYRAWTLQDAQDLVGPEGMRAMFYYGDAIPFGFDSEGQFRDFARVLVSELHAASVPLFDGEGRSNPEVRIVIHGSAVRGRSSERETSYRWNIQMGPDGSPIKASDIDIAIIVSPELYDRYVEARRGEHRAERSLPDGTVVRTKAAKRFERILGQGRLDFFHLPHDIFQAVNRARDRLRDAGFERGIQISLAPSNSPFAPPVTEQIVLSAELYMEPSELVSLDPVFEATEAPVSPPVPVARTGWEEVVTIRMNDRAVYDALARVNPGLAEFYRSEISTALSPAETMGDLVQRISLIDPTAVQEVMLLANREGRPVSQMVERAVFELVARGAILRGRWIESDPTIRPRLAVAFETDLRRSSVDGVERREVDPERARREREERGRARERDIRRVRP